MKMNNYYINNRNKKKIVAREEDEKDEAYLKYQHSSSIKGQMIE